MSDTKEEVVIETKVETTAVIVDPIIEKDAEIARLTTERDNYKTVALQRKGKLPADSEVLGEGFDQFIEEKVKTVLADKAINTALQERDALYQNTLKENAELRLALKNRPNGGLGSGSGDSPEVKDNVFSVEQLADLRKRAARLKADPEKFIEDAKKNLQKR